MKKHLFYIIDNKNIILNNKLLKLLFSIISFVNALNSVVNINHVDQALYSDNFR